MLVFKGLDLIYEFGAVSRCRNATILLCLHPAPELEVASNLRLLPPTLMYAALPYLITSNLLILGSKALVRLKIGRERLSWKCYRR
jgi:hypothetical protein